MTPEWKGEVPTLDLLNRMVTDPLPLGLRSGPVEPFFQRDIYFDSADWPLRRRGVSCRFRIRVDDRRILTLRTVGRWEGGVPLVLPQTYEADVAELEGVQALVGTSDPARRLRSLIDPALLLPRIQFDTERRLRYARAGWFFRGRYAGVYDCVAVRSDRTGEGAVVPVEQGSVTMPAESTSLALPVRGGSGEDTCREILRAFFGSADGQVRFLGTAPGGLASTRPVLEVWLARRGAGGRDPGDTGRVRWLPFDELLAAAGSPALRDPRTLAALALAARSDILAEW